MAIALCISAVSRLHREDKANIGDIVSFREDSLPYNASEQVGFDLIHLTGKTVNQIVTIIKNAHPAGLNEEAETPEAEQLIDRSAKYPVKITDLNDPINTIESNYFVK